MISVQFLFLDEDHMGKKILIVDDHEVLREGMRTLVTKSRSKLTVCGEASNGQEAIQLAQDLKPDVIVMDLTMPIMSGLEATTRIRDLGITIPILIFTMHDSEELEKDVRDAAAQGFVLKSQAARDLMLAIDTLLAGGTFFGPPAQTEERSKDEKPKRGNPFFRFAFAN
jgi:DNA-binding NarL/FixJ family response regulator